MGGVISFVSLVVAVEYVFEKSFIEKQFLDCTNELISALLVWVSQEDEVFIPFIVCRSDSDGTSFIRNSFIYLPLS